MARGVIQQEGEDFSPAMLEKVIDALAQEKPITKTAACGMLNIKYNTARLAKIIDNYLSAKELQKTMRKKMRSVPIDISTASNIVSSYLSGESLADISDATYRSTNVIKNVLTKYNVPIRNSSIDYWHPVALDEEVLAQDYAAGDLVYSARYDMPGTVSAAVPSEDHGLVCRIQFHGDRRFSAYQPYYELADLRRMQTELKIKMHDLDKETVNHLISEGLKNQKKQLDKRKEK